MASDLTPVPDDNLEIDATIQGLNVSQRIFGRYLLRRVLGRGGMGVVWLGYDERLNRDVALKFLPEAVNFDPTARDDLIRETRRCLDLTHPNIIRIYDFVNDQQAAAISMEYIDGKTLAALRIEKERRVFEADEIKTWIAKTCDALRYAHEEAAVVHRDLKPANIMLTSRGQIKIADFGISRSVSDSMSHVTLRRGTSGTLVYMSPQQMNGDLPRVTDDIYAIGATIYEFLTSRPPFYSGDIPFQVRLMVPKSMKERRKELEIPGLDIPEEWEEVVAACLSKVPAERPSNMVELAQRLGLSGPTVRTTEARRAPPPLPVRKRYDLRKLWSKFSGHNFPLRQLLYGSGTAVALALVGVLAWHFMIWPFIATPGGLQVTSIPIGATVHISGQADQVTPAVFPSLWIGHYEVKILADGFEPVDLPVTIAEGTNLNLGTIPLKRAFGRLELNTLPYRARYQLNGAENTGGFEKEGLTPDFITSLPSGTYQLTLSLAKLPKHTEVINVPPHSVTALGFDLIHLSYSTNANQELTKAFNGEIDPHRLDAASQAQLAQLRIKAFAQYLSFDFLAQASDQLAKLKSLGGDVSVYQKALADRRIVAEKNLTAQIKDLIDDKKFATADERLKNLKGTLELESVDRLKTQFQPQLDQYRQQISSESTVSGPIATKYDLLKSVSANHPDDLHVQLALSELEEQMPPNHDRLTTRLKTFRQFASENSDFATEPALLAKQTTFSHELEQLDSLSDALSQAINGPPDVRDELASLESQKASLERRRVGNASNNPFDDTLNFFGKAVTGHSVVNTEAVFSSQQEKERAIAALQGQINIEQQKLSQPKGTIADAQKRYDAFMAHVPWGQD